MAVEDHPFYETLMTITTNLISDVTIAQNSYFITNGKYFQGIKTPSGVLDGTTLGTIDETLNPTDQLDAWVDFDPQTFKKNSKVPYQIKVDVYESPLGWGWVLTGELWYDNVGPDNYGNDGSHWVHNHHVGPETLDGIFDEFYIQVDEEI